MHVKQICQINIFKYRHSLCAAHQISEYLVRTHNSVCAPTDVRVYLKSAKKHASVQTRNFLSQWHNYRKRDFHFIFSCYVFVFHSNKFASCVCIWAHLLGECVYGEIQCVLVIESYVMAICFWALQHRRHLFLFHSLFRFWENIWIAVLFQVRPN